MQKHLNKKDTINLGSFYTPRFVVEIVYKMLEKVNLNEFLLFDSSCGYGDFFIYDDLSYLGADIDEIAANEASKKARILHTNSLLNVSRQKFGIVKNEKLIIIGNPPYNDKTSIIRNNIKQNLFQIDKNLAFRDLGVSFLRSYAVLNADFVCVLHPLSYLIKRTNFNALGIFKNNYRLIDSLVISSQIFTPNSSTFFPIIIALYEKNKSGMTYDFIKDYTFKTYEGQNFRLNDFDFITNYVGKYPNPRDKRKEVAFFHTLRDINALKRNQTFMSKPNANSVRVFAENLKYYCYIHHFKQFANKLPYYFGNLDIFINNDEFLKIADLFLDLNPNPKITEYFERLFEEKSMPVLKYKIPLTKISGKVRIKERLAFSDYGVPIAPTKTILSPKHYIEWQISYDKEMIVYGTHHFSNYKNKKKQIYELSKFLLFGLKNSLISRDEILDLKNFIENNEIFVETTQEIQRTNFIKENLAGIEFLKSKVSYPLLVHQFKNKDILCEIIVREKQRAVGVMPMLYFCVPMSEIYNEHGVKNFIGRKIHSKECGYLYIDKNNISIFVQMFRIFGILSANHKHDCLEILKYILQDINS